MNRKRAEKIAAFLNITPLQVNVSKIRFSLKKKKKKTKVVETSQFMK